MGLSGAQRRYWRRNLRLTLGLLTIWFAISFVAGWYANPLNEITFLGFPLGFYLFAQGGPLSFLVIVFVYVKIMNRLDRQYSVEETP